MSWDYGEDERIPTTLISEKRVRAAKEHHCQCGDSIKVGQRYIRRFWLIDGEPYVEKWCGICPPY